MPVSGIAIMARSVTTRVRAVDREAHAAAHADAVDQRHIGFGVAMDEAVEAVFLEEEIARQRSVGAVDPLPAS